MLKWLGHYWEDKMLDDLMVIQTSRSGVRLRQFAPEDAPALFELIDRNREHLDLWGEPVSEDNPDLETVLFNIRYPIPQNSRRFGVWRGHALLGSIRLTIHPDPFVLGEIGYWLGSEYTRQGFATIATNALTAYASQKFELGLIKARVRSGNLASIGVLERVGFNYLCEADHICTYMLYR